MKDLHNPEFKKTGYIQVYTGEGKGKTTASMGLACRALGHGMKVLIMQFCKDKNNTGEYAFMQPEENLTYISCGLPTIPYKNNIVPELRWKTEEGWDYVKKCSNYFDMVILDELNIAIELMLIPLSDVIQFLETKPHNLEVVITGRNAHSEITQMAHLVTNMTCIKHYYQIGVQARKGVEY